MACVNPFPILLNSKVEDLAVAAGKTLGFLFKVRKSFSPTNLVTLYDTQIGSGLEYCSHVSNYTRIARVCPEKGYKGYPNKLTLSAFKGTRYFPYLGMDLQDLNEVVKSKQTSLLLPGI